eukprot:m51a1_g1632 hypothetical protein (715) ;mRNA; f:281264-290668
MTQVWVNWVAVWDVGWAHTPKKGKPERERERLGVPSSPDQAPAPQASMACRSAPVEREAMAAAAAPAAEPELSPEPQQQQDIEPEKANEQPMEQDKNTEQQDGDTEQQDDAEAEQQDKQQDEQEENQQDQIIKGLEAARAKLKEKIGMYKKEQVRVTNELHEQHMLVATLKCQNEGLKEQLELLKSERANWREPQFSGLPMQNRRKAAGAAKPADPRDGDTPLLCAAAAGQPEVVRALLKAGADPSAENQQTGERPLHRAALVGLLAVVTELLGAGADVNAQERQRGDTALHVAARQGHDAVARALLAAGADKERRNSDGDVPLDCALENGHKAVIDVLSPEIVDPAADADAEELCCSAEEPAEDDFLLFLERENALLQRRCTGTGDYCRSPPEWYCDRCTALFGSSTAYCAECWQKAHQRPFVSAHEKQPVGRAPPASDLAGFAPREFEEYHAGRAQSMEDNICKLSMLGSEVEKLRRTQNVLAAVFAKAAGSFIASECELLASTRVSCTRLEAAAADAHRACELADMKVQQIHMQTLLQLCQAIVKALQCPQSTSPSELPCSSPRVDAMYRELIGEDPRGPDTGDGAAAGQPPAPEPGFQFFCQALGMKSAQEVRAVLGMFLHNEEAPGDRKRMEALGVLLRRARGDWSILTEEQKKPYRELEAKWREFTEHEAAKEAARTASSSPQQQQALAGDDILHAIVPSLGEKRNVT